MMRTFSRSAAAVACAAALFTASACQDGDPEPSPEPTKTTTSAAPTPTKSAWESKYSAKQLKAYEAALVRFTEYEQRAEPIWARGKVTPGAEALFKEYWLTWPNTLNTLRYLEDQGITTHGNPRVIWSKLAEVQRAAKTVIIAQCIDNSTVKTESRAGTPDVPNERPPYIRNIRMDKVGKNAWRITSAEPVKKKAQPCDS